MASAGKQVTSFKQSHDWFKLLLLIGQQETTGPTAVVGYAKSELEHKPDVSAVEHDVSQLVHSLSSKAFLFAKLQHFYGEKQSFLTLSLTESNLHYVVLNLQ